MFFAEVDGCNPETDDFAAHSVGDVDGIDAVAEGFGHGAALLVEGPAGGGHVRIGSASAQGDRGEQRGVEPAAVLVAALEIEDVESVFGTVAVLEGLVGGAQVWIGLADGKPTDAGVEPDVENVSFFAEGRAAAVSAFCICWQELVDASGVPGFGAFVVEEVNDFFVQLGIDDGLIAAFAHKHRDGHAPDALAADAPVGAGGDHVGDALLAPGRIPDYFVDFFNRDLTKCFFLVLDKSIEGDEPLFGGAVDDGMMAAPAMWIGVIEIGGGHQGASLFKQGHDDGIGLPDSEAVEGGRGGLRPGLGIDVDVTAGIDAAGGVDAVLLAGREIVHAVRGRGVDCAGALVGGDVGGEDAEDGALEERMLEGDAIEGCAFEAGEFDRIFEVARGLHALSQFRSDDVHIFAEFESHVLEIGMEGYGHRRGQRPGSGGPDDGVDFAAGERGCDGCRVAGELVADVDGGAGVVFVLDFGFGQGGAVVNAPVNGLEAAVDEAFLKKSVKGFERARLIGA